jgi:beta-glucosidase
MRLLAVGFFALLPGFALGAPAQSTPTLRSYPEGESAAKIESRVTQLLSQLTLNEKVSLLAGDDFDGMSTMAVPRLGIPKLVMADGPQGIRAHGPACSFPSGISLAATWDTNLAYRYGEALGREARARGIHIQLGPGVNIARTPLNGRNFEYFGEDPYLTGQIASSWIRGLQSQGVAATVKHFVGNDEEWRRMEIDSVMDDQTLHEIYMRPFHDAVSLGGSWAVMSAYNKLNGVPSTSNGKLQNVILKQEWRFPGLVMSDWWATQSVDAIAAGLDLEMPMNYRITQESVETALREKKLTIEEIDWAVARLLRMAVALGFLDRPQKRVELPLDSKENASLALEVATRSIVLLKNEGATLPLEKKKLRKIVVYGPNAQDTPSVGGGSGEVTPFRKTSFLQGIRAALLDAEVYFVPMPVSPMVSLSDFFQLSKPTQIPPRITNIRKLAAVTDDGVTHVKKSEQKAIEISWSQKNPPDDIPKGREGRVIWDADIEGSVSGYYEIIAEGHPEIRLGGRELGNPDSYVVNLVKGTSVPLRVTASEVGRGKGRVSVKIVPVAEESTGLFPTKGADAAIVCVGLNPEVEGEGYDRGFSLPVSQQQLIKEVSSANPKTIVVLSGGAAVDMRGWIDKVPAVLQTWYLGESAGTALATILFGERSPSGHLPCTFDRSIDENPSFRHYPGYFSESLQWPVADYHEGIFYGYRGYDLAHKDPQFPFGFGLSYTDFSLSDFKVFRARGGFEASVMVSNTGKCEGWSVVQLYLSLNGEDTPRPLRELKGFRSINLKAGESKRVFFVMTGDSLRYWHPQQNVWMDPKGLIAFEIGFSERDIRLRAETTQDLATDAPQKSLNR